MKYISTFKVAHPNTKISLHLPLLKGIRQFSLKRKKYENRNNPEFQEQGNKELIDAKQREAMKLSILSSFHLFLLSIFLFSTTQRPILAAENSYIVYLGGHSHGPNPLLADLHRATNSHYDLLGPILGSKAKAKDAIFYSCNRYINAFAANLNEKDAVKLAKHPDVLAVFPNRGVELHTTRSWDFLGLESSGVIPTDSIWKKAEFGEDIIIANIDSGVWPESMSFSDEGMGPIPSKWRGICQNGTDNEFRCNRKLIGARYFNKGYSKGAGYALNSSYNTARDYVGHGTHTLSTAGGSFVPGASVFGFGNGTAKGGSPKARVVSYKVCWLPPINGSKCFTADIIAAFDAAINDGVDVLSVSMGHKPTDYFDDVGSIGAFHAVKNGIVVVCSGGNFGPKDGTVSNLSPWMLTVGASTIDRAFTSLVELGNNKKFQGTSISQKGLQTDKFYPLISGRDAKASKASDIDALLCKSGTLDAEKVNGKILVCLRGDYDRIEKGKQAARAGALGMILANDYESGNDIQYDNHVLPTSQISFTDGESVFAYINSTKFPVASMTGGLTRLGTNPSPTMALFSSKGPNTITPGILKPDITAPGMGIIAAWPESQDGTSFRFQSGTSISCPHVSGIVGLLKKLHPDWSPAAIKSAIMTTAITRDNNKKPMLDSPNSKATPFSYGAGHVRPNRAMDPGLVYDLNITDYLNFLCAIGYNQTQVKMFSDDPYSCPKSASLHDFNYPSITVTNFTGSVTITRTVKNVDLPGTYTAHVKAPPGISVLVEPKSLKFEKTGEEKKFKLVLKAKKPGVAKDYVFGRLIWSDDRHHVRSPIVVKAKLN